MKAEDTVIANEKIMAHHKAMFPWMYQGNDDDWCEEQLHRLISLSETRDGQFLLQAQAEISFPLGVEEGKKLGIKEVVEWGEQRCTEHQPTNDSGYGWVYHHQCDECWQAFKKSKGV